MISLIRFAISSRGRTDLDVRMESSKCSSLPQRVVLGVMGFLGIVVVFTMRACLSVAITEMVVPLNNTGKGSESVICQINSSSVENGDVVAPIGTRYNWSQEQQGYILSSFYITYVITHIPGAIVAQKFGGKYTLSLGILTITICTALTPIAMEYGEENALSALIILRMLMGLAGGTSFPALSVLLAAWIPEKERGKLAAFVLGGGQIGSLLSFYISGLILAHWPWPVVFYFWSAISIVWFVVFTLVCYNDPASHPFISKKELDYLKREMGQLKRRNDLPPTPWKAILTSVPVLAFIIAQVGNDWVFYVMASDLPKYMKEVLGFPVQDVGLYASLPYLLMWIISILSGFICDFIITKGYVTTTQARKIIAAFGGILPASFIVAASYAGCDRLMVVICFTLSMGFMGTYYPSLRVNSLDLSPNYSGSLMALTNGIAAIAGIIVPNFIGMMTPDSSLEQWRFVFWVTFAIAMFRTIVFSIWASAEVQPWNEEFKSPETHKLTEVNESYKQIRES